MNGLPYYKAFPRDFFEGTVGWPFELKSAYRLTLDLIYMHGGRLVDDPRFIAGHLGCSVRAWNAFRAQMIERGKIYVSDGCLANYRADKLLETSGSFQDKQRKNGSAPKKNKGLAEAVAEPFARSNTDTDKKKDSVSYETGSDAADPVKVLFDAGVRIVTQSGVTDRAARTFLGKLRRDHPGQDGQILSAIMECGRAGVIDPIPWITARMRPRTAQQFDLDKFTDDGRRI